MVVRDERDAYQQLQDQFSGQMDFATKMMEENGIEKERMVSEISTIQRQLNVALRSLHGVLEALANNVSDTDCVGSESINMTMCYRHMTIVF